MTIEHFVTSFWNLA